MGTVAYCSWPALRVCDGDGDGDCNGTFSCRYLKHAFEILGDPVRRRILELLAEKVEPTSGEFVEWCTPILHVRCTTASGGRFAALAI